MGVYISCSDVDAAVVASMYGGMATLNPIPTTLTWNPPRRHHGRWIVFVAVLSLFVTVSATGLTAASTSLFVTVEVEAIALEANIRPLLSPPFPMLWMGGECLFVVWKK